MDYHQDDVAIAANGNVARGNEQYAYTHNRQLTPLDVGGSVVGAGITSGETPPTVETNNQRRPVHPIAEHDVYEEYNQANSANGYNYAPTGTWKETPAPISEEGGSQNLNATSNHTQISRTDTTVLNSPDNEFDDPDEHSKSLDAHLSNMGDGPASTGGRDYSTPAPMLTSESYAPSTEAYTGGPYQPTPMFMSRSFQPKTDQMQHLSPTHSLAHSYQGHDYRQPAFTPSQQYDDNLQAASAVAIGGIGDRPPHHDLDSHDQQQQTASTDVGHATLNLGADALSAAGSVVDAATGLVIAATATSGNRHERTYTNGTEGIYQDAENNTRESSHTRGTYSDSRAL